VKKKKTVAFNRCTVHWHVLASKKLNPVLHETFTEAASIDCQIVVSACEEMDSKRTAVSQLN
jgi:hypothetical protein